MNTFEINFYCRQSKANRKGLAHIELSITLNGTRKFINLPMQVKPEEFNRKRQPVCIQEYCSVMRTQINQIHVDLIRRGLPLTVENIREYIKTGGIKSYTIKDLEKEFMAILKSKIGTDMTQGSYRKYEKALELINTYVKADDEVTVLTPALIQQIYADLKQGYKSSSSASYMSKIKTLTKFAIDNGHLTVNPFVSTKITREKNEIVFLTREELRKLAEYPLENESLIRVRDLFLVQCYSGLSYIDLEHLRKEDIQEVNGAYLIKKNRIKSGIEYTAYILPEGVEILRKYNFTLKVISNQKMNTYLHQIEKLANVTKLLHTHLGRKTYGNLLLSSGVSLMTTAKCLGHSEVRTTQKYYVKQQDITVINEINQALKK